MNSRDSTGVVIRESSPPAIEAFSVSPLASTTPSQRSRIFCELLDGVAFVRMSGPPVCAEAENRGHTTRRLLIRILIGRPSCAHTPTISVVKDCAGVILYRKM